jgi:hypothetical protein
MWSTATPRTMRPPIAVLLALAIFGTPRPGHAGPVLRIPASVVRTGETVTLSWCGLPCSAREVELEISLAGGRWLRISPELEASEGVFHWFVPPGLSGEARLRLRWGGEGFESDGVLVPLRIESAGTTPHPRPGPDWWDLRAPSPLGPSGFDRTQPAYIPRTLPAAVPVSPESLDAPMAGATISDVRRDDRAQVAGRIMRAFSPPRATPLRN